MEQRRPELYFSTLTGIVMMIFMLTALTNKELFHYDLNTSILYTLAYSACQTNGVGILWFFHILTGKGDQ